VPDFDYGRALKAGIFAVYARRLQQITYMHHKYQKCSFTHGKILSVEDKRKYGSKIWVPDML